MPTFDDLSISADRLTAFATAVLIRMGAEPDIAAEVAAHLVEADLMGVASHGIVRLPQYREQAEAGAFDPGARPVMAKAEGGAVCVDAGGGFGQPAMRLATARAVSDAKAAGVGAVGVFNSGHTGRVGAFAEQAAGAGCFALILGGGSRAEWRQVAPHGGAKAALPTNPYAIAIPGGEDGPVALDFATSTGAGGKILAAASAGRPLAPGLIVDKDGQPSTDPADYANGGALLPMAGPKGFGMALIAELLGEAIAGEARTGMNWMAICLDLTRYRAPAAYAMAAEACLAEIRSIPPAAGFERVETPGRRERDLAAKRRAAGVPVPRQTVAHLNRLAAQLGAAPL